MGAGWQRWWRDTPEPECPGEPTVITDTDVFEARIRVWMWWCPFCRAHYTQPHLYGHATFRIDE